MSDPRSAAPLSPLDSALRWLGLGYWCVPILRTSEKKNAEKGWQDHKYDARDLAAHIRDDHNVGILLGDEFGHADCDLDCPEAIAAGRLLLPETGIRFGRVGKPASHYFYIVDPATTTWQLKDPFTKAMICELRCRAKNGKTMMTMVPRSLHVKSGEWLRFEPGSDGIPAKLTGDVLRRHIALVAAASVLGRYYPAHGRNKTELALAGVLARHGWDVDDAVAFLSAVYACAPTNDSNTSGGGIPSPTAENSVRQTFGNYDNANAVTALPKLRECFGDKIKAVDETMKWLKIAEKEEKPEPKRSLVPVGDYKEYLKMVGAEKDKHPLAQGGNVAMVLRHDPRWAGALGFDEFRSNVVLLRDVDAHPQLKRGVLKEEHFFYVQEWFQMCLDFRNLGKDTVLEACCAVAKENPFHPVRDYLADLDPWTEETDEKRLDTWLIKYLGAEDKAANRFIGRKWLISLIARAMSPGCKVDTMMILCGEQGIQKSTALCALMPDETWFTDRMPDINSKDADIQIQGKWLIEWAELDSLRRADEGTVKVFLSQKVSRFRPPYGKVAADFPRQCVFAGSSNNYQFLKDVTGDRRHWPVRLGFAPIDIMALKRDRDQLWAEALAAYTAKEGWWPDDDQEKTVKVEQEACYVANDWTGPVLNWIDKLPAEYIRETNVRSTRTHVNTREILTFGLQVPIGDIPRHRPMVAAILRKNGWTEGKRESVDGMQDQYWIRR